MDSSEKGMNLEGKATKSYAAAVNSPVKPLSPHLFSSGSSQVSEEHSLLCNY